MKKAGRRKATFAALEQVQQSYIPKITIAQVLVGKIRGERASVAEDGLRGNANSRN